MLALPQKCLQIRNPDESQTCRDVGDVRCPPPRATRCAWHKFMQAASIRPSCAWARSSEAIRANCASIIVFHNCRPQSSQRRPHAQPGGCARANSRVKPASSLRRRIIAIEGLGFATTMNHSFSISNCPPLPLYNATNHFFSPCCQPSPVDRQVAVCHGRKGAVRLGGSPQLLRNSG